MSLHHVHSNGRRKDIPVLVILHLVLVHVIILVLILLHSFHTTSINPGPPPACDEPLEGPHLPRDPRTRLLDRGLRGLLGLLGSLVRDSGAGSLLGVVDVVIELVAAFEARRLGWISFQIE